MPDAPLERTPLNKPWDLFATPEVLDELLVQMVDVENTPGNYRDLSPGQPHPDQSNYAGYVFVGSQSVSHARAQLFWSTPAYQNQDLYNYDLGYVSDSTSHPVFTRRYLTLRTAYSEIAAGTALSGVWQIRLTNGGSGYDPDNPPTVTVAGTGSGCTATALVSKSGSVNFIRITAEGTSYTAAPTVTIAAPSSGTQATATAVIQATTCVLVKQAAQELPQDDKRYSLFLLETRVYQTFPGPELVEWQWIPRIRRYAKITRQLVLKSTVPADNNAETYADNVTVEYQDVTANYSAKLTTELPADGLVWEDEDTTNDYIYEGTEDYRFPDQIREQPTLHMLVAVSSTGNAAWDFAMDMVVEEGYVGPCRAVFKERYTYDPTDAAFIAGLPSPTDIVPSGGTIRCGVVYYGNNGQVDAKYKTWGVPLTLHPAFDYDNTSIIINGDTELPTDERTFDIGSNLAATTPTVFNSGDSILRVSAPQRLGVGNLWVVYIVEIYHP